jgi:hypothetical protein
MINAKINPAPAKLRAAALSLSMAIAASVAAIAVAPAQVFARDLLFLGVTDVRGRPVQPELESELRAEFAADRRFRLLSAVETERVTREMERRGHTRAEAVIPPNAGLSDSTVIVRGVVRELTIATKRSPWLIWGKIDAQMRLELNFSELSGPIAHRGEFGAAASKRKEFIFFHDPKKYVHVSVADREELLGRMRSDLLKEAVSLISAFFNAVAAGGMPPKAFTESPDTASAPDTAKEFSTLDGKEVAPIDSAGDGK